MWRRLGVTDGASGSQVRSGLIPARGDARTVAPPTAAIKFIGWNCRGKGKSLRNSNKMEYLAKMINSTAAQVTFVSETRSSKCTAADLNARFNTHASFVVPSVGDEVYPRQCPCRRAFDLGSILGTWRTRRRSDESSGTRGFTQVQPPRKVKGLRPACLTLY
jgi:hypothetical protein